MYHIKSKALSVSQIFEFSNNKLKFINHVSVSQPFLNVIEHIESDICTKSRGEWKEATDRHTSSSRPHPVTPRTR